MTLSKTNEQAFEWLIERALVGSTKEEREAAGLTDVDAQQPDAQQYYWGLPKDLDKKWAVDMRRLWSFLETTQKEELEKYTGSDIKTEVTKLHVKYSQNQFSLTRQQTYSVLKPGEEIDMVLFVNGIPLFTFELKNPWTGQTAKYNGKKQYEKDRKQWKETVRKR